VTNGPSRTVLLSLLACACAGAACSKASRGADPEPVTPVTVTSASAAPASSPASSASARPSAPVACALALGYRGTVVGQPVFARLGVGGPGVHGRYFYERSGIDIALAGKLSTSGALSMTETSEGKTTGAFEGTCDGPTGVLSGTWKGGKTSGPFQLSPIVPGDAPVVATHHFSFSRPAPSVGTVLGTKTCTYKESRVELFGLRDADAERLLGQGLEIQTGPLLDAQTEGEVAGCQVGVEAEVNESFVGSFREFATLERGGYVQADDTAHPTNALDYARTTYDLRTGKPVTSDDVFARDPMDLVRKCVVPADAGDDPTPELIFGGFSGDQLDLTAAGVHFFGMGYPHAYASATGQGPTIGYDVLLRDGYLKRGSPVARAWEGVKPAGKAKAACP
jgi:hypothetical protein